MMKQTIILICVLLFGLFTVTATPAIDRVLEAQSAACPCNCDKDKDWQALMDIYTANGGANWVLPANVSYQNIIADDFKNVPNAGTPWDVNAPNAKDLMGTWHGVTTNQTGCVTELVLWSGPYDTNHPFNFDPQGVGLTGELPESIGDLCALEKLLIPHNNLTGAIPTSIEDLCSLEVLLLHNNELSESIPSELGSLTNLIQIGLHYNDLTDELPTSITNLTNLEILHLNNNKLIGPIPIDIGNLDQAQLTNFSNNCFSGIVPASIVDLGKNSTTGQTQKLYLQNNKLDSLPNITSLQIASNNGEVDVSGNHFTFDDILPNINILTEYSDQTRDLNQLFCAMEGDQLVIRPGFDAMVDEGIYGVFNTYHWSRPGTSYRDSSTLNSLAFPGVTTFSAGVFAIEVVNPLAPDLKLLISNLVVEVPSAPSLIGTFDVCANSEESYAIFFSPIGYDFAVEGGDIISADTTSVTVHWSSGSLGKICTTDRSNCQFTFCTEVSIAPQVTVFITPPDTLNCSRKVSTLRGNTNAANLDLAWYNTTDTIALSQTDTIDITQPGNYVLQGMNDTGCEARDTALVIEQIDKFEVVINGSTIFCSNDSTTLSLNSNFSTYLWSTGATTPTIQVADAGQYLVTVTNENNCSATNAFMVESLPAPNSEVTKSGDLDCNNEQVQLFKTFNQSTSGNVQLEWRNANGDLLGDDIVLTVTTPGIYSLTAINEQDCRATNQIEVLKDESVVIPLIAGTSSLCEGTTGQLIIEEEYASYSWSTGDTTASIPIDDSSLDYTVTVTTETGCSGTSSITIIKRPKPTVVIEGKKEICKDNATRLFVDDQFANYNWSNGTTSFETTVSTAGTYSVTVIDQNNCINTTSIEVTEAAPFTATIEGANSFCEGTSTSLFAKPIPNAQYEWSTGSTSPFILIDSAGTYTVTITDASNCSNSTSAIATVSPLPTITVLGNTFLCEGDSTRLEVKEAYASYNWTGGENEQSIYIDQTGTYQVIVSDTLNCTNAATIEITEKTTLVPKIIGDLSLCQNGQVTLSSDTAYDSYLWSTGATSQSITVNAAGNYTLSVTDNSGCSGEVVVSVLSTTNPIPQILGNTSICKGTATNLTTQKDYATYNWSTGDTTASISINTVGSYQVTVTNSFGCVGVSNFMVEEAANLVVDIIGNTAICAGSSTVLQADNTYLIYNWSTGADSTAIEVTETGIYSLTVTDPSGCTGITTVEVTEESSIFPQIIGTTTLCGGQSTEISTDSDYASYTWSNGASSKSILIDSIGTYQVTVSNSSGCTGIATVEVNSASAVQPSIEGNLSFCEGQTTLLNLDTSYSSYLWTGDIMRPTLEVGETGLYSVTVTNENGCTGQAVVNITQGQLPPPAIDVETPFLCEGNFTSLVAEEGYTDYAWNTGALDPNLFVSEGQLYTVTVTDEDGCTGVNSIEIVVVPAPTIDTEQPKTICEGDATGIELIPPEFEKYIWSTEDTTATITVLEKGVYDLTITNEFGCTGTATYNVIAIAAPKFTLENSLRKDTLDCVDSRAVLVGIQQTPVPYTYRWEDEQGTTLGTAPVYTAKTGGRYKLIGTDLTTGCSATRYRTITELVTPVTLIAEDTIKGLFCTNRSAIINFNNSVNADRYEWEIHIGGGFKKELENATSTYTATEVGEYFVIGINNGSGCRDSAWVEVIDTSYTVPAAIYGPPELCEIATANLVVTKKFESYKWERGDTTQQIEITESGKYSVSVTDKNGCKGVDSIEVRPTEAVDLEVALEGDITKVCEGTAVELDFIVKKQGVGPYDLTLSNGQGELHFENIENNKGLEVFPTNTTSYSIIEVIDLGNSCSFFSGMTPTVEFEIQPRPLANGTIRNSCNEQGKIGATFDLNAIEGLITDDPSSFVKWYRDSTSITSIPPTTSFATSAAATTIYARVNDGTCDSRPVAVVLTVTDCTTSFEFDLEIGADLDLSSLSGNKREVYITNRWGDLVYASKDYEGTLDKFNGSNLPQGAYYIYIKNQERENDTPVPYKGIIYLLK